MTKYEVALVRFEGVGRSYPVNGAERYRPGDKVVVEMAGDPPRLKEAKVVGRSISYKPCRNSIVGLSASETSYLPGPQSIHTLEDLLRFMKDRNYSACPVKMEDRGGVEPVTSGWQTAYVCGYDPEHNARYNRIRSDYPVCLFSPEDIGLIFPSIFNEVVSLPYKDGLLILGGYECIVSVGVSTSSDPFHPDALRWVADRLRNPLVSVMRDPSLTNLPYVEGGF